MVEPHHQDEEYIRRLNERVAILESQGVQLNTVIHKLETAIDRLTEVSGSLKEFIAIHDHRLQRVEDEVDANYSEQKISRHDTELQIASIKTSLTSIQNGLEAHIKAEEGMLGSQDAQLQNIQTSVNKLGERIGALEKWRWVVIGGAAVAYVVFTFGAKVVTEGQVQFQPGTSQQQQQQQMKSK